MRVKFKSLCGDKIYSWDEIINNPVLLKNTLLEEGAKLILCTNYHDLEGVPIYEGDILQYYNKGEKINEYYYIEWRLSSWSLKMFTDPKIDDLLENALTFPLDENIRVIGNIYENKDIVSKIKEEEI